MIGADQGAHAQAAEPGLTSSPVALVALLATLAKGRYDEELAAMVTAALGGLAAVFEARDEEVI